MPCKKAMIANPKSVTPEHTVGQAFALLRKMQAKNLPVVDENGVLIATFGFRQILKKLLPVAATAEHGLDFLEFMRGATPGVVKRLKRLESVKIADVMDSNIVFTHPDTPMLEGLRLLMEHGRTIPVVEDKTNKLVGVITMISAIDSLVEHYGEKAA